MSTQNYIFLKGQRIGGERASSGDPFTVPMVVGDYAAYDNVTQKLSLFPNAGDFGYLLYVPYSTVANLTGTNVMGVTGITLPSSLPTPH